MANGHRAYLAAGLVGVAGVAMLVGCARHASEPARLLRTEDFLADPAASREVAQSPVLREYELEQPQGAELMTTEEATEGVRDVSAAVGSPVLVASTMAAATERPVLIDAKIGEINGRPIRVDEIFKDRNLERRLIERAREEGMTRNTWLQFTHDQVRLQLEMLLQDELLRAEALASLKPEQRMGLRYMVQEMSENMRRQAGGSRAEAERRLREQGGGSSLQQMQREREATLLVQYQIEEKVRRRVRVSWKDVRLYYERNFEFFNPPATANLRVIQVPKEQTEAIANIQEALDSGRPFAEVAAMPGNMFNPAGGGKRESPLRFTGELATAELDLMEPMASTVRSLKPGEFNIDPVDFQSRRGTDKMWVYLDSVSQRKRPLSSRDVQREIADLLTKSQLEKEIQRHIGRLMERASYTDLDDMTRRLLEIAIERYWPTQG